MKKLYFLAMFQLCCTAAFAQLNTYTAKVIDSNNEPIPGATVNEVGTQNYAITTSEGEFALQTEATHFTIQVPSSVLKPEKLRLPMGYFPLPLHYRKE